MRPARAVVLVGAFVIGFVPGAHAQQEGAELRTLGRLGDAVRPQIDSARASGLPIDPLVKKAQEGEARGAPDSLIVEAVRGLRLRMQRAAGVVGSDDRDELVAAADALFAGIDDAGLQALAEALPRARLVTSLTVFTDLVRRGVTAEAAAGTVLELARAGADEETLARFRLSVLRDIADGVEPVTAARARARSFIRPPAPSADAREWGVAGPLRPATGAAQLGFGVHGSSRPGSRSVHVGLTGWLDPAGSGGTADSSPSSYELIVSSTGTGPD